MSGLSLSGEFHPPLPAENPIHLWDVDHPYYCNEGNYFASPKECCVAYQRWQDFITEQGENDLDMNLLFRWDWDAPRKDGEFANPVEWQGDENYRDCTLKLFFMGQRKGYYRWVTVDVCRADEPAVCAWLQVRWEHMKTLWAPFATP